MADKSQLPPGAPVEKHWQKVRRMQQHEIYRGSKYPPMSIEHMPYERQRLSGSGMTAEDRQLRRQWLKDQELSKEEPRRVPELRPRNFIRRLYQNPMNIAFLYMKPAVGEFAASMGRILVPKMLMAGLGIYWAYYMIKYHPNDWTRNGGMHVYESKPMNLGTWQRVREKGPHDHMDRGFSCRKVLLDLKTSRSWD